MTAPQNSPTPRRPVNVVFIRTKNLITFPAPEKSPLSRGLYHIATPCQNGNYKNIKDHNNDRGSNLTSTQVLWVSELYFWPDTGPTLQDPQAGAQGGGLSGLIYSPLVAFTRVEWHIPDKQQRPFQMKESRFIPLVWSQTEQKVLPSLKAKRPVVTACSTFVLITSLTAQDF